MVRLSRLTDYGILLLATMAKGGAPRTFTARELAEETRLPLPTVSKVLKTLTRAGVLVSHRGVVGGYGLARPAEDISLLEAVAALEGPVALTQCSTGESCSLETQCCSRTHLQVVNDAIVRALQNVRLAELARPAPRFLVLGGNAE